MVKIDIKVNKKQGTAYIPKTIRKVIGREVVAIPNTYTVLIFNKNINIEKVLSSLDVIKQGLLLQLNG